MGSPSRSIGTARTVRKPAERDRSYAYSGSSATSTWTTRASGSRGPSALPRPGGSGNTRDGPPSGLRGQAVTATEWIRLPSKRKTLPLTASHNRAALSAIASKTGWRSVGELEMTRRISAVAVCCSSASVSVAVPGLELLEQPHVLDGDHRLVSEGLDQLDLLVGERLDLELVEDDDAKDVVTPEHRHAKLGPDRTDVLQGVTVLGIGLQVGNMNRPSLECCSAVMVCRPGVTG